MRRFPKHRGKAGPQNGSASRRDDPLGRARQPRSDHRGDRSARKSPGRASHRPGRSCPGTGSPGEPDRLPRRPGSRNRTRRPDRPCGLREGPRRRGAHLPLRCEGRRLGKVARVSNRLPGRDGDAGAGSRSRRRCRFLHISSTSAYGHPAEGQAPIDETAPLGENVWILDYYTSSKVECERLLWRMAEREGLPLTVIRPSWLFGERDRTTAPRLIREFRRGRMMIVGKGDNPLSAVYAGVVADAAILAAPTPAHGVRPTTSPARARSASESSSICSPMRCKFRV